jgi:hypothetical protein
MFGGGASRAEAAARFDGPGVTKDASGFGLLKELLRMMESSEMFTPGRRRCCLRIGAPIIRGSAQGPPRRKVMS